MEMLRASLLFVIYSCTFCQQKMFTSRLPHACRTKYVGEGSAACMLGLCTGLVILMLQRYLTEDSLHQLLTFNPADFFT